MPSEVATPRAPIEGAMEVARPAIARFQSALVRAVEDVRAFLAEHRAPSPDRPREVAAQLGSFGAGRIDPERFAGLLTVPETLEPDRLHRVEKALGHLEALASRGEALYRARVPPGGDLRDTVLRALATVGGAFGMIRVVASARDGSSEPLDPAAFTEGLPVSLWGSSERRMAPPLVVEVRGEDLAVGGLTDVLDGGLEVVLVVDAPAAPAPLARLIAPGIFVTQISEPAELGPAIRFPGPTVAALMPEGCARFTHDPEAGDGYAQRLNVLDMPAADELRAIGRVTVSQQRRDLEHLHELSRAAAGPILPAAAAPDARLPEPRPAESATPADRLAGWLIQQAGLNDGG